MRFFFENNMATVAQVKEAGFFYCFTGDPLWNNVLPSSQRERRVSRLNRTGKNTTGWARRLTALLVTACLVMAMALPVYAEEDPLPDAPDEVELLEDKQGTASGENTVPPEQNAATPVPDAATPEPEQSAEPEQPAPAETPEPTAEPTPTPEPTEQPQMDAEEAEDVDGALEVSTQSNQFTVYFAVPSSWEVTKNSTITFNAQRGNGGQAIDGEIGEQPMHLVPDKITSKGQRIYKFILTNGDQTICPWGGYVWMQFTLDESHKVRVTAPLEGDNFVKVEAFNDRYYDGDANSENGDVAWNDANWADASALPDLAVHTAFGGQRMVFENLSDSDLANVTAVFTEQESSGNTTETVTIGAVAKDKKQGFKIPTSACSSVQFFAENGSKPLSESYNFYEQGTDENTFLYNASKKYCFTYKGNNQSTWGTPQGKQGKQVVYFDATFSWLSYEKETSETHGAIGCGMPTNDGKLWCYLTGNGKDPIAKQEMNRLKDTNIWYYEVPDGYTKIRFASWAVENENAADNGNGTAMMDIPADLSEPCFFADASDDVIYKGGNRRGYWAEKGSLRDAEKGKSTGTKVVDIKSAPFTEEANTKYVTSTLYDYYTDYELNGNNRGSYDQTSPTVSHRNWVPFRQFDQALSGYYEKAGAQYPIYTGHFQPGGGTNFSDIATTLNLFGYSNDDNVKFNRFMAINNSQRNDDNTEGSNHTNYAYQGLVADTTSTGKATGEPLLKGTGAVEPHFNKDFLLGENSKNAKLGEVYENVKFPFTKVKNLFDNETDVDYWCFDSKDTTLYLKQDSGQNSDSKYFLQSADNRESSRNVSASSNSKDLYGYFPFNETANPGVFSTYNYGFGTKLQMDFTLTDDGKVETKNADGTKGRTSIKFFFSGDDDVWVFIDGQLALDVGGAHGEVSGLLEFGEKEEDGKKKNSVTAYVSRVKKGGTSDKDDKDKDEKNGNTSVKTVTYNKNKEVIDFYAKGTTLTFDKGQKHTLTMYYMERGMWESNMAVAFNFPDNNELQVQKEVDLKNVTDPAFQNCFKNQKIFNFTIQNQATHYGEKKAVGPNESGTQSKVVDLDADVISIAPAITGSEDYIFKKEQNQWPDPEQGSGQNTEKVLHWYARYMDTEPVSYWRKQRYGILKLKDPINIKDMRFLTFQVYVGSNDGGELSLNNLYLELLDEKDIQKGSLGTTGINGATYGSVEVVTGKWVTVKLDLHKMKEQDKFSGNVTTIRVGDNYNRNIYFRNFTFIPKAVPTEMTGFTTDQEKIPDYGSAKSGHLENAENAQYTSSNDTDTQLVEKDGRFVLEAGETVTFSDQFRRGSYISLKEDLNTNLYDTTWTVCENGQEVESMSGGDSVSLPDSTPSLKEQEGSSPNDGRTEKIRTNDDQTNNNYKGTKPEGDTIVFRSYKDPDEKSSTLTKLKVKYVNTVKTGGLTIQKEAADDEEDKIKGIYTFKVTFSNVGGEGLEDGDIIREYTINMNDPENPEHICTITGIPVGTRYTIEEVGSTDGAKLQSVTVPPGCDSAHLIKNNTMVEGVIEKSEDPELTAIFTNTQRTLINIEFDKLWKDANGSEIGTANQPDEIYIQLQRRLATSQNDEDWTPVNYPTTTSPDPNYVIIKRGESHWQFTFSGLDQYQINKDNKQTNYVYRIVEGTVENGSFTQAVVTQAGETITIKGNTYVVKAEAKAEISEEDSTKKTQAKVNGGTITGDSGKIVLTNKLQNPKFVLDIIKKDAERNNEDQEVFLKDVEFKLEKLKAETTEGEPQVVDTSYVFDSEHTGSITATTDGDGKITKVFTNLEPGTYRLTETKAHPGYNLLAQPIKIQFTQDGKYKIDDGIAKNATGDAASGYTVTLTVLNRKTPELPHTGADAPSLWLLIGMPLAVAGLLIFTFRYNRKGGRRH
jgi:fibro-slime domain-containing protein/LPXTG-motif cell wall-anchored protein